MSIFSSDLLFLSANLTVKLRIADSNGVCFQGYLCQIDFIQNRLFKQREQINEDMYLIYNSHVLGTFVIIITKTRLFKYIENFTSKN